jgi:glycosyltransferase involved in cell wall biosynthesis
VTDRRKIVHVHKIAGVSGSEKHILQLLGALDRRLFEPVFLMLARQPDKEQGYIEQLRDAGVRVDVLRIRVDLDPLLFLRLVAWFRRERPDVVHTHLIHADAHAVPAARLAGVPVVVSTKHNDDPFRTHPAVVVLERWLARRVDRTIAISESLRRFTIESTRTDPAKVLTVRYGYDAAVDRPVLSTPSPVSPGAAVVLAVGRLVDQKGHDVLIEAFARVCRRIPDATLVIVGGGEKRPALEGMVSALGLRGRVILTGHRSDARAFMRDAAVFAHPSRWEGFGLVLLEAMADALPIVASRVSAIPEIVEDGVTGVLVAAGDHVALADALLGVLLNPERARRMGRAGRERLERDFSLEKMARATENVYRGALAAREGLDVGRMNERAC